MPDYSVPKASDTRGDADETISLSAWHPHVPPPAGERERLRREIVAQARDIGSRVQEGSQDIDETELTALLQEALAVGRFNRSLTRTDGEDSKTRV